MVEGFPWVIFVEKQTGRWTDQPTNGPSYRDARTHLKTWTIVFDLQALKPEQPGLSALIHLESTT